MESFEDFSSNRFEFQLGSIGDKAWRSRVGKKLKFSLSQLRLDESLESLRKSNQDFRTLAAQTSKLEEVLRQPSQDSPFSRYSSQKIEDCRLVQKASTQLYQALERACQSHENHSAHFRLESEHVSKEESGFPLVRFNIAFTHGGSSARLEPAWIAVDSTFDDLGTESLTGEGVSIHEAQIGINELSNHLKHELKHDLQPIIKRIKTKSVRFAETSQYTTMTARPTVVASFLAHPALPDFCVQHDLCHQLQRHNSPRTGSKYLGYLHKSGPWKHLVHFAPPIASYMTQQPVTLTQIVSSISQKVEADQFLQYERLRLARQLASAVLQFHATPLLRNSWRSEDVVFFNSISSTKSLTSPHLNVQVGKLNTPGSNVLPENPNARGNESNQFIRNPYLFSLGVILIELACQAPLNSLREDCDLVDGQASKYTDYFVANRVSRSMGSSLGVNYAKVVRKCLGCDFGEGTTELKDPGLQAVFYKDVVCELERLERAFAMLQLGT